MSLGKDELILYFKFLDELRILGAVNMFGAGPYLMEAFELKPEESKVILRMWMETFNDKSVEDRVATLV